MLANLLKKLPCLLIVGAFIASCTKEVALNPENVFRVGVSQNAQSKDPLFVFAPDQLRVLSVIYETLLRYSQKSGEFESVLLSELPTISADQLTYTFNLKANVKFHPALSKEITLTSKDAIVSLLRGTLEGTESNYGNLLVGLIEGLSTWSKSPENGGEYLGRALPSGIHVVSAQQFTIKLTRKYPDFLALLTLPAFSVVPAELLEKGKLKLAIGSGVFAFANPNVDSPDWKALRVENHYSQKKSTFAALEVVPLKEASQIATVDIVSLPLKWSVEVMDPSTLTLKGTTNMQLKELRPKHFEFLVFNLKDPTITKLGKKFRQDLVNALDREEILKAMYLGFASGDFQLIPKGVEGGDIAPASQQGVNLEASQKSIKKSLGSKTKIKIPYPESASYWIPVLQKQLEFASDNFVFEAVESTTYLEMMEKGDFQLAPLSLDGDLPEATNYLQIYYGASKGQNLSGYSSKSFDQLFEKLSQLFPSEERKALAQKAHLEVLRDIPVIPLGFKRDYLVVSSKASAFNPLTLGLSALRDLLIQN